MFKFNIGTNFDYNLIKEVVALREKYGHEINFYGSLRKENTGLPTARPDFRIPNLFVEKAKEYIQQCHNNDIKFNYTLNSPLTEDWFSRDQIILDRNYDILMHLNVDIITVSHPIAIRYFGKKDIPIEISTILEVDNINSIKYYLDNYNVSKICLSIRKNRDRAFLFSLVKNNLSDRVELLANEFCTFGGMPCSNFNRKNCYELHAMGGNRENEHGGFPMIWCSASRYKDPVSWLKAFVIYPWDLGFYRKEFGIFNFKLSGRTLPTEFILRVLKSYVSEGIKCPENLLELWGHVDKVGTDNLMKLPPLQLSTSKLKKIGFVQMLMSMYCDINLCEKCGYCKQVFDKIRI